MASWVARPADNSYGQLNRGGERVGWAPSYNKGKKDTLCDYFDSAVACFLSLGPTWAQWTMVNDKTTSDFRLSRPVSSSRFGSLVFTWTEKPRCNHVMLEHFGHKDIMPTLPRYAFLTPTHGEISRRKVFICAYSILFHLLAIIQ